MVKNNLWRIVCLVWAFIGIILVLKCQVSETAWQRSADQLAQKRNFYAASLNAQEVEDFIRTWPKFRMFKFSQSANFSYETENPADAIDWKARMWLTYNHWDVERFFYVQQRILSVLNAIEVKKSAQAVISELNGRQDDAAQKMMELQKMRIDAEQLDETEYLIIAAQENVLRQMFKEYPY